MKPQISFHIILLILTTFFFSCSLDDKMNCEPQKTIYVYLPEYIKKDNPYNGSDTLYFVRSSLGDTLTFKGIGINNGFTQGYVNLNYNCPNDKTMSEFVEFQFQCQAISESIYYKVFYRKYQEAPQLYIDFKKQHFEYFYAGILSPPNYYDSIKIMGKWYYDVNYITDFDHTTPNTYYILYNKLGIIRMKLLNGETWDKIYKN